MFRATLGPASALTCVACGSLFVGDSQLALLVASPKPEPKRKPKPKADTASSGGGAGWTSRFEFLCPGCGDRYSLARGHLTAEGLACSACHPRLPPPVTVSREQEPFDARAPGEGERHGWLSHAAGEALVGGLVWLLRLE